MFLPIFSCRTVSYNVFVYEMLQGNSVFSGLWARTAHINDVDFYFRVDNDIQKKQLEKKEEEQKKREDEEETRQRAAAEIEQATHESVVEVLATSSSSISSSSQL